MENQLDHLQMAVSDLYEQVDGFRREINEKIDRLYTHVDGFIHLHQTLDLELAALRSRQERFEERLHSLEVVRP